MGNRQPTIIKFKKRILSFEDYEIRVVTPIDTLEGHIYVKPIHREGKENYIDHLYNIMSSKEEYINPTTYGNLSWWSVISCMSDSGDALEIGRTCYMKFPCEDVK